MRYATAALLAIAAVVASACAGTQRPYSVRRIIGPGGHPAAYVTCASEQLHCYDGAANACPHGYAVLDKGGQTTSQPVRNWYTGQYIGNKHTYDGYLVVGCYAPDDPRAVQASHAPR